MPPEPSSDPSEKQLEVLRFIIKHIEDNGFQPTQSEMAVHFGVSKNAIQQRLRELARKGVIEKSNHKKIRERAININRVRFVAHFDPTRL